MIQNHVDLLSGKVYAVLTCSMATATDSAAIILATCACAGGPAPGFPMRWCHCASLVMDHKSLAR